jgi:hypothetical protein
VILERLDVPVADFERATGWAVKPQGACKDTVCVPLPDRARLDLAPDDVPRIDVEAVAERLGMPLVGDDASGLWGLGPETAVSGRALTTAVAPELELPDFDGNPFRLSTLLGQKVLLVAWASW